MKMMSGSQYGVDSVAGNLSQEDRPLEETKQKEADEVLYPSGPSRWVIPMKKVIVCSSGFNAETKENIKSSVEKLGGRYIFDFTQEVTVLITKDNNSDKYKIARDTGIHTVTARWLKDSIAKDFFLNPKDFLFPPFHGRIVYFYHCGTEELKKRVTENRGVVQKEVITAPMASSLTIVVPEENVTGSLQELRRQYSFFSSCFEQGTLKLVTIPWIDAYVNKEKTADSFVIDPEDNLEPPSAVPHTIHHKVR